VVLLLCLGVAIIISNKIDFNFCACMEGFLKFSDICKAEITFGNSACYFVQEKQHLFEMLQYVCTYECYNLYFDGL